MERGLLITREEEEILVWWSSLEGCRETFSGTFTAVSPLASTGMFFCFVYADYLMMFVGWG